MKTEDINLLRQDFTYDPDTGFVFHTRARQKVRVGDRAGVKTSNGYRVIGWRLQKFLEHRMIFALVEGRWPPHDIDHKNNIRDDNRWCNLREATRSQNNRNTLWPSKSGLKGAYFDRRGKCWRAIIKKDRKQIHLGMFDTPEQAHEAYCAAARDLAGEFTRTWPSFMD